MRKIVDVTHLTQIGNDILLKMTVCIMVFEIIASFLGYLPNKHLQLEQENRSIEFSGQIQMQFNLHLDNPDKDDAKKSSEPKGDDS